MADEKPLKLGAKVLASMALPGFCPRCYWYRLHAGDPPFAVFPSIFNHIDLFTKHVVHSYIDKHGCPPKWLGFSDAVGYVDTGFLEWMDADNNILLKGAPDLVMYGEDQLTWIVADYKTARYSNGQDHLLEQYKVQLLGYSFLLTKKGYKTPERAALLYFQPPAPGSTTPPQVLARVDKDGFAMPFSVEVVDIELGKFDTIRKYLARTREIYDQEEAPEGRSGCRDCKRIDNYRKQGEKDERSASGPVVGHDVQMYVDNRGKRQYWTRRLYKEEEPLADSGDWFPQWAGDNGEIEP